MYKIKTMNKISPLGLEYFETEKFTVGDNIEAPDAVMVRSASLHDTELPASLKAIARAGAGVNNIPVEKCSEEGVVVFNTPGANANAVKELVVAGLLLCSRKVIPAINWALTLKGKGEEVGKLVEKGKGAFVGPEIQGKKLGVIGLGAIGIQVANAANRLGMNVYGYDPYISVDAAWNLSRDIFHAQSLKVIFAECDYISLHLPLNKDTSGFINKEAFAQMKDGARILNFSRAALVNDADIVEALDSGRVAAYVVDFPTDEILGVEGVIAIPHLGASTPESEDNCATMAARQLIDFLENGNICNSVNLPDVEMPYSDYPRVCIVHRNIPNMLTQIAGLFAKANINIENMQNRSKKDYAYTMMDIVSDSFDEVVKEIEAVDGIIRVRVIK